MAAVCAGTPRLRSEASAAARRRGAEVDDAERLRLVERQRIAAGLDRDLRRACRAEVVARRAVGVIAREMLRRRAYQRLGFVRLSDYARERLGISARALESAAWVATRLDGLPRIAAAFARGALSWTQARLLCAVARAEDEVAWLARARGKTVEELEALIDAEHARRGDASTPDPEDDRLEGEAIVRLRLACPARLRALWRRALELARRVAGEPLATWRAAELIAAEGIAGRPTGAPVGDRALLEMMRLARQRRRAAADAAHATRNDEAVQTAARLSPAAWVNGAPLSAMFPGASDASADANDVDLAGTDAASTPTDVSGAAATDALIVSRAELACCDAFALDTRLRAAVQAIGRAEPRIGRLLRVLVDHRLYRVLGFRSTERYVRERLGLSLRKAWALLKIEKTARRAGTFAAAYEQGRLSWVRALTLVPVVDRHTAGDWIVRASAVTVRRLTDEVNWVLDARDALGPTAPLGPPPLDSVLVSLAVARRGETPCGATPHTDAQCHKTSLGGHVQIGAPAAPPHAWTQIGTGASPAAEVADAEIQFSGPASVVALFRDALDAFARTGEPRWTAVERLLTRVIADWEAEPHHRDPVFARDGWRCTVPACSARRHLHDHHLRFRSRGGGNERANRTTVCAAHHLHGIHAGVIRAWGTAPHAVHWELGVRPGTAPLLAYVGDRLEEH